MADSIKVFQQIVAMKKDQPLVVFDLDSTLFNVSHRTKRIINEFTQVPEYAKRFPNEVELLKQIDVLPKDWGFREALERTGLTPTPTFANAIRNFWRQNFFNSLYLHEDTPYLGAVDYVNAIANEKIKIMYLTGRDEPNMRTGTIESLAKWQFPLHSDEHLIMKPGKGLIEDADFKNTKIKELKMRHPKIWFFENEPLIIHQIRESSPDINIIWIDTTHSKRATPPVDLPTIGMEWKFSQS